VGAGERAKSFFDGKRGRNKKRAVKTARNRATDRNASNPPKDKKFGGAKDANEVLCSDFKLSSALRRNRRGPKIRIDEGKIQRSNHRFETNPEAKRGTKNIKAKKM